LIIFPVHYYE